MKLCIINLIGSLMLILTCQNNKHKRRFPRVVSVWNFYLGMRCIGNPLYTCVKETRENKTVGVRKEMR